MPTWIIEIDTHEGFSTRAQELIDFNDTVLACPLFRTVSVHENIVWTKSKTEKYEYTELILYCTIRKREGQFTAIATVSFTRPKFKNLSDPSKTKNHFKNIEHEYVRRAHKVQ